MSKFFKRSESKNKVTAKTGAQSRACAAFIVNAIENGQSFNTAFAHFCMKLELDDRDKAFVSEIVYGTLRHRRLLNKSLEPLLEHKIQKRHSVVKSLLLCAMYQLIFMRTPPHAVVSATVSACALCQVRSFVSMVNAILRRFLREGGALTHSLDDAVEFSFPDWLYKRISADYGDKTKDILINSNEHAPLFLRVLTDRISLEDYLKELDRHDIDYALNRYGSSCVEILQPLPHDAIPLFKEGMVTIQDLSAQLAAPLLNISDNLKVLDTCAAPGGKSAHILSLGKNINLTAIDIDESRLKSTQQTLDRLKLKAELKVMDAKDLSSFEDESFDRILVDAPCSGTGVIRRHPDIKWLRRDKDIESLCQIQKDILNEAFKKLKTGGILLYTTCSILKCENEEQIKDFVKGHDNARFVPVSFDDTECDYKQVLPSAHGGDGFFYARVTKI